MNYRNTTRLAFALAPTNIGKACTLLMSTGMTLNQSASVLYAYMRALRACK